MAFGDRLAARAAAERERVQAVDSTSAAKPDSPVTVVVGGDGGEEGEGSATII
jgi:hypothetical protein